MNLPLISSIFCRNLKIIAGKSGANGWSTPRIRMQLLHTQSPVYCEFRLKWPFFQSKTAVKTGHFNRNSQLLNLQRPTPDSMCFQVRLVYSLMSDTQKEWNKTGFNLDFVSDPKSWRGPSPAVCTCPPPQKK